MAADDVVGKARNCEKRRGVLYVAGNCFTLLKVAPVILSEIMRRVCKLHEGKRERAWRCNDAEFH